MTDDKEKNDEPSLLQDLVFEFVGAGGFILIGILVAQSLWWLAAAPAWFGFAIWLSHVLDTARCGGFYECTVSEAQSKLSFAAMRAANVTRLPLFKNAKGEVCHTEDGSDWSDAEWLEALTGELGEYANLKKKVRRGDYTFEEAQPALAAELADVQLYLDLLAYRLDIDLGLATVAKFNEVSKRVGVDVFLTAEGEILLGEDLVNDIRDGYPL